MKLLKFWSSIKGQHCSPNTYNFYIWLFSKRYNFKPTLCRRLSVKEIIPLYYVTVPSYIYASYVPKTCNKISFSFNLNLYNVFEYYNKFFLRLYLFCTLEKISL